MNDNTKFDSIEQLAKEGWEPKYGRMSVKSNFTKEDRVAITSCVRKILRGDLLVYPGGTCELLRDVKKGETIIYNNTPDSLDNSPTDNPLKCEVYEDLKAGTKLKAGANEKGRVVIEADKGTGDWLVVHIQE